jgi:hypothetical protein
MAGAPPGGRLPGQLPRRATTHSLPRPANPASPAAIVSHPRAPSGQGAAPTRPTR